MSTSVTTATMPASTATASTTAMAHQQIGGGPASGCQVESGSEDRKDQISGFDALDGYFAGKTTHDDTHEETQWKDVQLRTTATSPTGGNINGKGYSFWRGEEPIPFLIFGTYDLKLRLARIVKVHLGDHNNHVIYELVVRADGGVDINGAFSRGSLDKVKPPSPRVCSSSASSSSSAAASTSSASVIGAGQPFTLSD